MRFYWIVYYWLFPPKGLHPFLRAACRCMGKFKPYLYRNESGKQWEIMFTNESDVVYANRSVQADLHIGRDTGNIVGLTIRDRVLQDRA